MAGVLALILTSVAIITIVIITLLVTAWLTQPTPFTYVCKTGECPTNLFTGVKHCDTQSYDPTTETCQPADSCSSSSAPCAVQPDGSSLCPDEPGGGVCSSPGCTCSAYKLCPYYVTSYFIPHVFTLNGNRYYTQWATGQNYTALPNQLNYQPPLSAGIGNNHGFCDLTKSALSVVANRRCLAGNLTQIQKTNSVTYACTIANECPSGLHPVYNVDLDVINCQEVPDWPNFS
jgi:hypothetical protein